MLCAINHQNCSRNLIFTSRRFTQLYHFWRICWTFEQVGLVKELWVISDLFVGHPFSSRGIKDHQCGTPLMWSEEGEGWGIDLQIWLRDTLEILILPHHVHAGRWGRAEPNSPTSSCTCHTPSQHRRHLSSSLSLWMTTFCFSPSPSLLFPFGRIKLNCIVCDRHGVRFGTNLRQTTHSRFMVSFHLTCWCVGDTFDKNHPR